MKRAGGSSMYGAFITTRITTQICQATGVPMPSGNIDRKVVVNAGLVIFIVTSVLSKDDPGGVSL
jgi:hypothetical protein